MLNALPANPKCDNFQCVTLTLDGGGVCRRTGLPVTYVGNDCAQPDGCRDDGKSNLLLREAMIMS